MSHPGSRKPSPAPTEHVAVPGGTLAVESIGTGPGILFVHAAIADRRMWDREAERLAPHHRVVRFDLRGYGGSPPPNGSFSSTDDLMRLIRHAGLDRPVIVGASMGGALAINLAIAHPEAVGGLFLLAPGLSGGFDPPFTAEETAALAVDERESQAVASAWSAGRHDDAVEHLRKLWGAALTGPALALFRRMVLDNAPEVFEERSARWEERAPPAFPRLGEIRVPTAMLVGDRDNPFCAAFGARIARAIPRARLISVPGADHLINLSAPEEFDRRLDEFLAEVERRPRGP